MGLEAIRQAMRHLWAHKVRSTLTLFGLVWGAAAVIFLVGWGRGVTVMLEDGFFRSGKNMGEMWPGKLSEEFTPAVDRRYLWFTLDDVELLRKRARLPELIGAESWEMLPVAFRQRALSADVRGMDPEATQIRGAPLAAGRNISHSDLEHRRRVAVLGHRMRGRLLGADGGIGSWIRIAGKPFKVVGLLDRVGTQLSRDRMELDDHIWIPITTLQAHWPRWWTQEFVVTKILYRMRDRHLLLDTEREVRAILAARLRASPDDQEAVRIFSSVKMLNTLPLDEMNGLLFILAAATLVIGGVGTLNMMLDAVFDRRQEIGVRLAVGARRRDIVWQFFLETLTITALGGMIGVGLGIASCWLLAGIDAPDLVPVPILEARIVFLALGVLGGVGLLSGVIPAWRASRIDPALTLRME
jgi:putative ABC transport system permease protein